MPAGCSTSRFGRRAGGLLCAALAASACARFGYSDRVLLRVPSPDGRLIAVCQEIPEFDGPGYDIRVERGDGALVRRLYRIGDGDPCSEIAWSPDGRTLVVLSSHVARLRFVDVTRALADEQPPVRYFWPQVDLSAERDLRFARELRFAGPRDVEVTLCSYSLGERQSTGAFRCTSAEERRRVRVPL
jgi:hypothetical protein